jgi:predicted 3-demethylubiquinone-9 3-methyltransferase (glyoxalase superfamily)
LGTRPFSSHASRSKRSGGCTRRLSEGVSLLMPLNNYGFNRQFGWVNDRFGVSWQLNLE